MSAEIVPIVEGQIIRLQLYRRHRKVLKAGYPEGPKSGELEEDHRGRIRRARPDSRHLHTEGNIQVSIDRSPEVAGSQGRRCCTANGRITAVHGSPSKIREI